MIKDLEENIRYIINYTNCGEDEIVYRDSCALRYDALVKLSTSKSDEIKRNSYLYGISKIVDTCQKKDVENIIAELVKNDLNNNDNEFDVNVRCKLGINDSDIYAYEKILELAIQNRLKIVDTKKIILDSINIETSKDGKNIVDIDFKLNKNLEQKIA